MASKSEWNNFSLNYPPPRNFWLNYFNSRDSLGLNQKISFWPSIWAGRSSRSKHTHGRGEKVFFQPKFSPSKNLLDDEVLYYSIAPPSHSNYWYR